MSEEQQPNPFAPPATDIEAAGAPSSVDAATVNLATRWQRFGGAFVDGLIIGVATAPAYLGVAEGTFAKTATGTKGSALLLFSMTGMWGLIAGALLLAVGIVNWTLLASRGQSLGKIAAGTRVVMLDGSRAPFTKVVVLRTWIFQFLPYIPGLNSLAGLVGLIDVLFIFRADRRCLHDQLAGTKVVRATLPT